MASTGTQGDDATGTVKDGTAAQNSGDSAAKKSAKAKVNAPKVYTSLPSDPSATPQDTSHVTLLAEATREAEAKARTENPTHVVYREAHAELGGESFDYGQKTGDAPAVPIAE